MDQEQLAEYTRLRDPIARLAARLLLDGLPAAELRGACDAAAADEVAAGLAEAEAVAGARSRDAARRRLRHAAS